MLARDTLNSCCQLTMALAVAFGIWFMALGGLSALSADVGVERVYQPTGLLTVHQDLTGRVSAVVRNYIPF
ncbi:MAG: hypothetical protein QGF59_06765 [Pirellulaceae bacterium]|jgi:hypothetical protein|nr:hypothetical protein [Pirellulaceae bacterium]